MGFINRAGGLTFDKETSALTHEFLYLMFNLQRFINPIFKMADSINCILHAL